MDELEFLRKIDQKLGAIVAMLADMRARNPAESENGIIKTEVILSGVGLTCPEIAKLLSKNAAAVSKAIQRSKR